MHKVPNSIVPNPVASKRKWLPGEEDAFIEVWFRNLYLFESGKKLVEIYADLALHFREVGIDISVGGIKTKMESFKRKYMKSVYSWKMLNRFYSSQDFSLYHADRNDQLKYWKHFDTMSVIMGDNPKVINGEEFEEQAQPQRKSSRKSNYMDDRQQHHTESEASFNSVYVQECCTDLFNDEESNRLDGRPCGTYQKNPAKKKRQRFSRSSQPSLKARKIWETHEETKFLDIWEKYAMDILGEKKNLDVYADMQSDLQQVGIDVKPSDIKSKIESFKRSFKVQMDSVGNKSKWIHYGRVQKVLNPLEFTNFPGFSESSNSSSDDDASWFNEPMPVSAVEGFQESSNLCSISGENSYDELHPSGLEVILGKVEPDEEDASMEHPPSDRQKVAEEFSQFVTKELAVLNDDLLIEAKRRIYNVICIMQMKQNELKHT